MDQFFLLSGLFDWQAGWVGQGCVGQNILGHCPDPEAA